MSFWGGKDCITFSRVANSKDPSNCHFEFKYSGKNWYIYSVRISNPITGPQEYLAITLDGKCGMPLRHEKDSKGNYFTYISVRDGIAFAANSQWSISNYWKMK